MAELWWNGRRWSTEDADEALRNLTADERDAVCKLYLYSNNMTRVPESVTMLRNLEVLWVGFNEIAELPLFITQLTALKDLDCSSNRLSSIPPELSRLVNLEKLWLGYNSLSSLPCSLVKLTNLQK